MQARIRRLRADYERVAGAFTSDHPFIAVVATEGDPPEKYTIEFRVRGLSEAEETEVVLPKTLHRAEVFLPLDYPRRPPFARMITPVFHPNIDPQKICIGDHWSAGQSLAQLIARIAEMICFQSYNVKSPLNAKAAAWAEQNMTRLPLQTGDLSVGL
jgi:ubiquitin-protein ligase